ncbi:MAG: tetratricopeptide repeat protein [Planctomycetota bacterium]
MFVWTTVLAVFLPALRGGYVDDDLDLLISSPAFAGPAHLWDAVRAPFWGDDLGYWRPLTSLLMSVGHTLGGGHPWPTHALAVVAHLGAATLVFAIFSRFAIGSGTCALAAAAFALNPCQVESVAWVAALGDPLAGAATLLSVWGWLRWRQSGAVGVPWLAWLGVALALASKESGITAVGWLIAAEACVAAPPVGRPTAVRAWGGVFVVVLLWLGLRMLVFGDARAGFDRASLDTGAHGLHGVALRIHLAAAFLVLPSGWLGFTPYRWIPPDASGLLGAGLDFAPWLVVLLAAWVTAWRRRPRALALGVLGTFVAIAPAALLPQGLGPWPLVDRYAYLVVVGVVAAPLASGACRAWLALVVVAASAVASGRLVGEWRDQDRVVARAQRDCPLHPETHYLFGRLELERAEVAARAVAGAAARRDHLRRAALAFRVVQAALRRPLYAGAHLREVLGFNARLAEAMAALTGGLRTAAAVAAELERLAAQRSDSAQVQVMLGVVRAESGDLARAETAWRHALDLDAGAHEAAFNLGRLYAGQGRLDDARAMLALALHLNPQNSEALRLLGELPR